MLIPENEQGLTKWEDEVGGLVERLLREGSMCAKTPWQKRTTNRSLLECMKMCTMGVERDESRVVGSQDTHRSHVQDLGPGPDAMRRQSSNHLNPGHELLSVVTSKMPFELMKSGSERKELDKLP